MIWLIGSKGILGSEIAKQLTQHKIPWIGTNSDVDITNYQQLESFEKSLETSAYYPSQLSHAQRKVQWIINCTEYSDIEKAEDEIDLCNNININGAQNIARLCRNIGCKLIHISSDYVYDGKKSTPYSEEDTVNPLTVYGKSKAQAEVEISRLMNTYYIFRVPQLYGNATDNLITKLIEKLNTNSELKLPETIITTPTSSSELTEVILKIIDKSESATSLFGKNSAPNYGIYNYSSNGQVSLFDLAVFINKYANKYGKITNTCNILPCSNEEYNDKINYPSYLNLNKEKISKSIKIKIPGWESSLEKFIKTF